MAIRWPVLNEGVINIRILMGRCFPYGWHYFNFLFDCLSREGQRFKNLKVHFSSNHRDGLLIRFSTLAGDLDWGVILYINRVMFFSVVTSSRYLVFKGFKKIFLSYNANLSILLIQKFNSKGTWSIFCWKYLQSKSYFVAGFGSFFFFSQRFIQERHYNNS